MKYTNLLVFACAVALFSCKNDDKSTTGATNETANTGTKTETPAQQVKITDVKQTVSAAKTDLANIDKINQTINELPEAVKKANKATIDAIRTELGGMVEKTSIMVSRLETYAQMNAPADNSGSLPTKPTASDRDQIPEAEVKDFIESIPRNRASYEQLNQQVQDLAKGQKKQ